MNKLIVIYKSYIILVDEETSKYYIGYDILTEELKKVPKSKSIGFPKVIFKLFKDPRARYILARNISEKRTTIAHILGISERQVSRLREKYIDYNKS